MKVLLVEDDRSLAQQMRLGLRSDAFEVDIAINGNDGLYMLTEGEYDAAVVDWMLPELDGKTLVSRVRKAGNHIPIIMATALGQIEDKLESTQL